MFVLRLAAQKLLVVLFVVLATATLLFVLIRLAPGDPAVLLVGPAATQAELEAARIKLGLNESLWTQYVLFLQGVVTLDFGFSRRLGSDAMAVVLSRLPATIELAAAAMILASVIAFPIGATAGANPRSWYSRAVTAVSLTLQSLPVFWVGVMFIMVFARWLNLLPSSGSGGFAHLLLPALTLALGIGGLIARLAQTGMTAVHEEQFITVARAKGLTSDQIVWGHGVKNMMIPVITLVGLQFGALLGGAVVVESVFSWPGLGRLLVDAIANRDYSVVQAATIMIALFVALCNVAVDLLYAVLDPRIRRSEVRS